MRIDDERLALHALWHANREAARSWEPAPLDREEYARQFGFPHRCAREIAYYDPDAPGTPAGAPGRLVGLGLCDETAGSWSAIYFFHHPDYARWSPGVFHIVNLAQMARRQGKQHLYLGYRVSDCASMRYKSLFRPHELLLGRPAMDEPPRWERSGDDATGAADADATASGDDATRDDATALTRPPGA